MASGKLYCYVDETGQDTQGSVFVVTVVVPKNRDETMEYVRDVEVRSGKGKFKWGKAAPKQRLAYLSEIFEQRKYPLSVYYSVYKQTKEYTYATVLTIAKSIHAIKDSQRHSFVILVDGLSKKGERNYGSQLHQLGVPSKKVKGVKRDENDALIRLADSICGFIRDVLEKDKGIANLEVLYKKAIKDKVLTEV